MVSKELKPIIKERNPAVNDGSALIFPLAGRLDDERERLLGMTDEEREYRKQFLKDQILDPDEPVDVPEVRREFFNPIRRFYRYPLNKFEDALTPFLGRTNANYVRFTIAQFSFLIAGIYGATYYFKYAGNNWTTRSGWRIIQSRQPVYPGHPDYPKKSDYTKPSDYYNCKFKESSI